MRLLRCYTIVGLAVVGLAGTAAFADQDMMKGKDSVQEIQTGIYLPHGTGNQNRVREYDGRTFPGFGVESYSAYGYDKGMQYRVDGRDLMIGGDEDFNFLLSCDSVLLRGSTSALTHRLLTTPNVNPWVGSQLAALTPAVPPASLGTTWDTFKDLSPGATYELDRRVSDMSMYINADPNRRVGLVTEWWQETEQGQQQLLFRARAAKAGVVNNSQRAGVALPIDRETSEATLGTDVAIGSNSVVNFRYTDTKFADRRPGIAAGSQLDFSPLNTLNRASNETQSRVIKARSSITPKLQFTGVQTNRERTNGGNDIPAGYNGAGGIMNKRVKTSATNLALVYTPVDALSLTGRWRHLGTDNGVPPIFSGSSVVPSNLQLSNDTQSMEFEGVYTGISNAYLRFGVERREEERTNSSLHPGDAELDLPFTTDKTDWNIQRASLRYHPISRLNISGNYENWSADVAGFVGTPNNRKKTAVNATYMLRDNMAIYGDLSQLKENNSQIRVDDPSALPTPSTDEATSEERNAAAGQGMTNDFKTASIGTWISLSDKLTVDANFGSVRNASSNWWILGYESAYVPHLPAQVAQFKSNDTQWSASANYAASRRLKARGGFTHSYSDGASYVDPTKFAGLGPEWTPFKVIQDRWSVGCSYGLSGKDSLNLDYSIGKWRDQVDSANNGTFQLYRVAWGRKF